MVRVNKQKAKRKQKQVVAKTKKKTKTKSCDCSICMDEVKDKATLPCKHSFCKGCIVKWSETSTTCPNCREPFTFIKHGRKKIKVQEKRQRPDHEEEVDDMSIGELVLQVTLRFIDSQQFRNALARDVELGDTHAMSVARVVYHMLHDRDSLALPPGDRVMTQHILNMAGIINPESMQRAKESISTTWLSRPGGTHHPILI